MMNSVMKNAYSKRTGVLAEKLGMCRMKIDGKVMGVTLLHLKDCRVVKHIKMDERGYNAVQVGIGKKKSLAKPQLEMFAKLGQEPVALLKEFRVSDLSNVPAEGESFTTDFFELGQKVDVIGKSKGKGFAGGMKAHGFHGLRATHGVSVSHRSLGSTGNRTDPGRVFPGRKMPCHLGSDTVTTQNLKIVYKSADHNVIGVMGAVPGSDKDYIQIRDTVIG